jgi:hypothetical protein
MDGDKALTANFSIDTAVAVPSKKAEIRNYYFAPKYITPWGGPVSWGGVDYEAGMIFENGVVVGLDVTNGIDLERRTAMVGIGVSVGGVYDLGNKLQLAYGGAMGLWYLGFMDPNESKDTKNEIWPDATYNFLAPFVKLRWDFVELTYRGLLGFRDVTVCGDDPRYWHTESKGLGWNHHQLMTGFYFSTLKREDMKFDKYVALRYSALLGQSNWTGFNLETGLIFDNGVFGGIEFGLNPPMVSGTEEWSMLGFGVSLGYDYNLWDKLHIACGGSAGFWWVNNNWWYLEGDSYDERYDEASKNILAPFVRLRWGFAELTYRGLCGFREVRIFEDERKDFYHWENKGFGLNSHQLMLGLYFATSKRGTPK